MDKLKKSKAASLAKVATLMRKRSDDLDAFLTADPKGKNLPGYLGELSNHLAAEQSTLLQEMDLLINNIDHIKNTVAMQQSCAKVSGVTETVKVADLVEDASSNCR